MATTKEELLASTLRVQIVSLEKLLHELTSDPDKTENIIGRIQQVESKLHHLRANLTM